MLVCVKVACACAELSGDRHTALGVGRVGRVPTCAPTPKGKSFAPAQDWSLYRNRKFVARKTTTLSYEFLGSLTESCDKDDNTGNSVGSPQQKQKELQILLV